MTKLPWVTYKLAPDSDKQERFIVTSEDLETEVCGIINDEEDAAHIVKAANMHNELVAALRELLHHHTIETIERAQDVLNQL